MRRSAIIGLAIFGAIAIPTAPAVALVATYHYDNHRSGWNQNETTLTPANVGPTSFGVLAQVVLDSQVDAQPLVVPHQQINGLTPGNYLVVYVATEANTIYAINAANGKVLLSRNLGTPVPTPLSCGNNGPTVGINGTPVIDAAAQTLYVVTNTLMSGTPTHQLFALNLSDLTNKIPPVTVAASHTLSDGTTFNFNAKYQRQRTGLLLSFGIIYAGFGSFCDLSSNQARGWLLGWQESTLAPLAANRLTDTLATDIGSFYLSSIWMSGSGIAARGNGDLFFSTGNSDPIQNTYDGVRNIQESVVKVDPTLVNLLSIFTPFTENVLDQGDNDLGSGGVLLLPAQPGPFPFMDVAAGKAGTMYLLNEASLGGFTPGGPDKALDEKIIGRCWCGPSYFTGPDGIGRVVSSGGSTTTSNSAQITVWKIQTSPTVAFVQEGAALPVASGDDPGTFTTVSSNGTQAGTAIIWATGRPTGTGPNPATVNLYAFAATPSSGTLPLLFSSPAGSWPYYATSNANIVPVVANGRVFVASYQQLTIFGLGGHPFVARAQDAAKPAALNTNAPPHEITGVLEHADGPVLTLRTRAGKIAQVDDSDAIRRGQIGVLVAGNAYTVQGTYDSTGALRAQAVLRAKASPAIWPPDR